MQKNSWPLPLKLKDQFSYLKQKTVFKLLGMYSKTCTL